ncbi:carboxy terminal-processing peptidase [soil metagenome]
MFSRILITLAFVGVVFTAATFRPSATTQKDKVLLDMVLNGIQQNHYADIAIDDKFSERVYELYLKNLDFGKRFFTQGDIEAFAMYKTKLDDQMKAGSYEFFELTTSVYQKRQKQIEGWYKEILAQPFNFEKIEDLETDVDKRNYPKNEAELKELWRKQLKFQVLTRIADKLDEQEKAEKGDDIKKKTLPDFEKEARERVLKTHTDWYHRMSRQNLDDYRNIFLNSIAMSFDPHTSFLPPEDKENFDISMSGKLEGIGATLQEEGSYIKVTNIVPGSPSWKQGDLKVGDIILKVAQGKGEPVDIVDMAVGDAVKLIRGDKGTEVRLTVKKVDGAIKIIPIVRDVVILEETYAKSAVLQKNGEKQKVGYISLPKFYADFSRTGGANSGDDVRKEVLKLKKQGIDGLVIDLRNNGGGSLQDVVDMAGLFIPSGPIVQVKSRMGQPYLLEDRDPNLVYEGPLVILVNEFSASASEILAAAMQDYKRAVIIGSSATFGKGTVQRFIDLDENLGPELASIKPLGVLKLTTQKFYRINGQTTQLKGVIPDVILPSLYSAMNVGEKDEDYPLPWDVIPAVPYQVWDNSMSNFSKVSKNSTARVSSDKLFGLVLENAERLNISRESSVYSLHLGLYRDRQKKQQDEGKKYEAASDTPQPITVYIPDADRNAINADESKKERTASWHKDIQKDIYLLESLCVVKDIIELPKNPVSQKK